MKTVHLGAVFVVIHLFCQWILGFGSIENNSLCYPFISFSYGKTLATPLAINDTIIMSVGCGSNMASANVMENDIFEPESAWLSQMITSDGGKLSYDPFGNFNYIPEKNFRGEIKITYKLSNTEDINVFTKGVVSIYVGDDFDCDNVFDSDDLDDDNDGIVDFHEGDCKLDSDGDGFPDCRDIDSDNDGITDFAEWQLENESTTLLLVDENCDGWDDAFDPLCGGNYYELVDTDMDGTPDFLDDDSDDDGISDFVEAFDTLNNQTTSIKFSNFDNDFDGLDDRCDTIVKSSSRLNSMGSKSPLPDHNNNGIRDWQDPINNVIEGDFMSALGEEMSVFAYPNPVVDKCKIIIPSTINPEAAPYSLSIYNTRGERVVLELLYGYETELSLHNLRHGLHIIRIQAGATTLSTKIVKSNKP